MYFKLKTKERQQKSTLGAAAAELREWVSSWFSTLKNSNSILQHLHQHLHYRHLNLPKLTLFSNAPIPVIFSPELNPPSPFVLCSSSSLSSSSLSHLSSPTTISSPLIIFIIIVDSSLRITPSFIRSQGGIHRRYKG